MTVGMVLAGWVAATAIWTNMTHFTLSCTGNQVGYTEQGSGKISMPWQETFYVDLNAGTFCSQGCAQQHALGAVTADGLDLENSISPYLSSFRRFHAGTGAMEVAVVTGASAQDRFHLEETGSCQLR